MIFDAILRNPAEYFLFCWRCLSLFIEIAVVPKENRALNTFVRTTVLMMSRLFVC